MTKLNGVNVGILITSSYVDPVGFFRGGNFYCSRQKSPRCSLGGGVGGMIKLLLFYPLSSITSQKNQPLCTPKIQQVQNKNA